jgi:hypothetical protein
MDETEQALNPDQPSSRHARVCQSSTAGVTRDEAEWGRKGVLEVDDA